MTATPDTRVTAVLTADDSGRIVSFDPLPFLAVATWKQLSDLVECGFGDDYATDEVARWMAASDYLPDGPRLDSAIEEITDQGGGFGVHLDADETIEYLAEHRLDWLLNEVFTRIHARDEVQAALVSPEDRYTWLLQVSEPEIQAILANALYNSTPRRIAVTIETVAALVYRLTYVLGPAVRVAELLTEPDITGALKRSAPHADRAALYRAAGIPADEARTRDADPQARPDEHTLRTLGALRGK